MYMKVNQYLAFGWIYTDTIFWDYEKKSDFVSQHISNSGKTRIQWTFTLSKRDSE